jgi:glycosyltransferase involved in cell wall biosynthesis
MGCIGGNELEHNSLSSLPNDTNETNRPLSLLIPNAPPPPPKARLILIGDGPCFEEVRRDAEEAGLGAQVVFMGGRPNADRYFNGADVAVLLSSEPEAFGLTLLEAMSRGKPVLASCIGGIPEIVKDHETGLLVTPGEAEMAASAVCSLANSAMDRQRLGKNGRKRWEEYFTVERMIHGYAVYFKMLDLQGKA